MSDNPEPGTRNAERAPHALLLAAGQGARFGGNKLLAPLEGRPLIDHVATTLAAAIGGGILRGGVAVVPVGATALLWPLDTAGLTPIENPRAPEGIATSLRRGLDALAAETPGVEGALIILADQPALRLDVIAAVVAEWRRSRRTTRPRYLGAPEEPGHPVLLDRRDWPLADRLTGDQGLRALLDQVSVSLVDVTGDNPDVDTPGDLGRFEESR